MADALKWLETSPKAPHPDGTLPVILTRPRGGGPRPPFVDILYLKMKRIVEDEKDVDSV